MPLSTSGYLMLPSQVCSPFKDRVNSLKKINWIVKIWVFSNKRGGRRSIDQVAGADNIEEYSRYDSWLSFQSYKKLFFQPQVFFKKKPAKIVFIFISSIGWSRARFVSFASCQNYYNRNGKAKIEWDVKNNKSFDCRNEDTGRDAVWQRGHLPSNAGEKREEGGDRTEGSDLERR